MKNKSVKPLVRYIYWTNTIKFPSRIGSNIICDFSAALGEWQKKRPYDLLNLDFESVTNAYSNGMVPIIATVADLRLKKNKLCIILPNDNSVRQTFKANNWAFYLDNNFPKSESKYDRHMVTRQFTNYQDVGWIVNDFMDVVMRSMKLPKDIFSALEWSTNEICDNVINHSDSKVGGFVEMVTVSKSQHISFTVADAGKGILKSLKEGIPNLRNDIHAIGEAIKAGVTRNKDAGQGNGLAGSLRITSLTNGSLDIVSGTGRFYTTPEGNHNAEGTKFQRYNGTSVSGLIRINTNFSMSEALNFTGGLPYVSTNMIDLMYEMENENSLLMKMKDETVGFGTRKAGQQLRTKILNLINNKPGYPVNVEWVGIPVISSSFADEFMGKLFLELGPTSFISIIRNKGMESLVRQLIDKAITQRLSQ